jgi:aryl-alcohol dehydrogenase-like predicted oxidoreductase
MRTLCASQGVHYLCYGTVAGGFLHERYLGAPAPLAPAANRSLVKYALIIDECGGWERVQALLRVLAGIGAKHGVRLGTVAIAWVLRQPGVAGAIVGARDASHLADTVRAGTLALDAEDIDAIEAWIGTGPGVPGDVYALERDRSGPHGRIMKYDLNAAPGTGDRGPGTRKNTGAG